MPKPPPTGVKRKVHQSGSTRRPREREHLTPPQEVAPLVDAARRARWGLRDSTLLLMLFTHGLRVSEALRVRWTHLHLDHGVFHIRRLKNGLAGDHRLRGVEIRAFDSRNSRLLLSTGFFATSRGAAIAICSTCVAIETPRNPLPASSGVLAKGREQKAEP